MQANKKNITNNIVTGIVKNCSGLFELSTFQHSLIFTFLHFLTWAHLGCQSKVIHLTATALNLRKLSTHEVEKKCKKISADASQLRLVAEPLLLLLSLLLPLLLLLLLLLSTVVQLKFKLSFCCLWLLSVWIWLC